MPDYLNDQLRQEFEECRQKAMLLESELDDVRELMNSYRRVLEHRAGREQGATTGSGLHAMIRPSQISHCKTQRESWLQIARRCDGFARPTEGAPLLIEAGKSDKDPRTVANNATSWMSDDDLWVRKGPGLFRLTEYDHDVESGAEKVERECVEESFLALDGVASDCASGTSSETTVPHKQSSEMAHRSQ